MSQAPARVARVRNAFLPPFPHIRARIPSTRVALLLIVLCALAGGAALGWLSVVRGPIPVAALLVGLVALVVVASDPRAGLWAVFGVVTVLPFAVIPVRVGLTLTLLEASVLGVLGVWVLRLLLRRDQLLAVAAPAIWIMLLLVVTLFAFLLGIENAYTTQTFHDYGKFVLAVVLVYAVWNTTLSTADARRLLTVLVLGASTASALGLVLFAGGPTFTQAALARLIPYGYPSTRIVRYIEDDPGRPMRLTSTSVDPNSFGGLLAVVFVIAVSQAIARNRLLPRWITVPALVLIGAAMLLTQSRGAWVATAAGLAVLTVLRYRWLILPGAGMAVLVVALGLGSRFLHRFWLGLTLQDAATRLRLAEYRNALAIIREHPLFGVGFGSAPSVELQTGVSSIYLTIAERTGFLGLGVFSITVGLVLLAGFRYWLHRRNSTEGDLALGLLAGFAAALTVGVFDHYFFNITFPHMAALFWTVAGLLLALAYPPRRRGPPRPETASPLRHAGRSAQRH